MKRFLEYAKVTKYYNYYQILTLTGLYLSEALGLQIKDIKIDVLEIRRGITADGLSSLKNKNAIRDIPLNPKLKSVLLEQKRLSAFITPDGQMFPSESHRSGLLEI
ncbi:MAG TPA: hypothetical protein GXZ43_01335 [Clostridiaceae bacterium]|nr:hypothetical protein [Clostridiaceae bacterium]